MAHQTIPIRKAGSYDEMAIRHGSVDSIRVCIKLLTVPTTAQLHEVTSVVKQWFSAHTWFNIDPAIRDRQGWLVRLMPLEQYGSSICFNLEFGALDPESVALSLRDQLAMLENAPIVEITLEVE